MAAAPAKTSVAARNEISGFRNEVFTFHLPIERLHSRRTAAHQPVMKERIIG
jgi:hypothetical protein